MAYVTLGIFSFDLPSLEGSILLMLSHGLVSSALFMCVGIIYDRHKTRIIKYYSGLIQVMPLFVTIFFPELALLYLTNKKILKKL